jgi:hypothetical protein
MLGSRPVNIGASLNIRPARFQDTGQFLIERHMLWRRCHGLANPPQHIQFNRCFTASLNSMRLAHS